MTQLCPRLKANASCGDASCTYRHDLEVCELCNIVCDSAATYQAHLNGKRHRRRVSGTGTVMHCSICKKNMGVTLWSGHINGAPHRRNATRQAVPLDIQPEEGVTVAGEKFCNLCSLHVAEALWSSHCIGSLHKKRERFLRFKSAFDESEKDKHGVIVSGEFDLGIRDVPEAKKGVLATACIRTDIPSSKISLVDVNILSRTGGVASSWFSIAIDGTKRILSRATAINLTIKFSQEHRGRYEDRLELLFEDPQLGKQFAITRSLKVVVGSKVDHDLLRPVTPYVPRQRAARTVEVDIIPGIVPVAASAVRYVVKLPQAKIPQGIISVLSSGPLSQIIRDVQRIFLPTTLDHKTHDRHFKNLLWIEEFKMEEDLQRYDIDDAKLAKHNQYYYLNVPGLAEKRPSVLIGDRILVQRYGAPSGQWYEGRVHVVRQQEVGLCFHTSFAGWTKDQKYNVRFKLTRTPVRRQHQALDTAFSPARLLFPVDSDILERATPSPVGLHLKFHNKLIAANPPQLQAVTNIVSQKPGSAPFIVFGPPGTGKTVTAVEAILQILARNSNARILACAPSNSAADLIAMRLRCLDTNTLFRFYGYSRFESEVPDELMPYTHRVDGERHFSSPMLHRLKTFKVIVSTCVSASFAYNVGMPRGSFTHIFIDEAGQATEPEVMIAIKTMADNNTNIILSGDPKQLGPIIRSPVARSLGLEISLLERLMNRDIYDEKTGHGVSVVKLIKNFRSHKAILKFPNERFYRGELEACANPKLINSYLGSPILVSKRFPIIFHAISGKDDREASSPSFFNIDEVTQVKTYVTKLKDDRGTRATDNDIGVIAPYHAQCLKVRASLKASAGEVKVGSVEEFQGQERKVIIISTVRSSRNFVDYDLRHTLGFVANPRRFNVAVTRAQALLIVVGDPSVLSLDPLWRSFMNYVFINGGWTGPPPTWDTAAPVDESEDFAKVYREKGLFDMNNFTRRMEEMTLAGAEIVAEDDADANVDRPWRDMD